MEGGTQRVLRPVSRIGFPFQMFHPTPEMGMDQWEAVLRGGRGGGRQTYSGRNSLLDCHWQEVLGRGFGEGGEGLEGVFSTIVSGEKGDRTYVKVGRIYVE